jgi:pSer/pThr/pTyr-binding forkhead associated (FHA) protein/tetratricopeptide (TPR) repeat protein
MPTAGAPPVIESVEVVIKQAGHADRVVRLSEGATRMGRAEDNEIVLSDVGVSRRHAQVYVSRAEVMVEDLGSGNGTYYNGYRIQSQPVQDGDEIVIDPFVLHFRVHGLNKSTGRGADDRGGGGAPARLQVVVGSGMAGSSYPISSRGLSIGRSEDRDVVIADPAASRHHCQISLQGGEYVLRDMGSANGVFVNAVRVRECTLADGDLVRIGNTEMRFTRYDGSAVDAPNHAPESPRVQPVSREMRGEASASMRSQSVRSEISERPMPRQRGSVGTWIGLFLGGSIVLAGVAVVVIFVAIAGVLIIRNHPIGPPSYPAQPPRWTLNLPVGLAPAPVDGLFADGQAKMRDRDYRSALQDFYRVLQADPGYDYVDKFAFAAGEYLVLDVLGKEFAARADDRAKKETARDRLLQDYRNGNRTAKMDAEGKLKRLYGDDPVVIKAIGPSDSASAKNLTKMAADAAEQMKNNKYDQASTTFQDLLEGTRDPDTRNQVLSQLKLCQKEVARASAPKWTEAVMAEASGDKGTAKKLFQELKEEHPANPSPPVHLERLP